MTHNSSRFANTKSFSSRRRQRTLLNRPPSDQWRWVALGLVAALTAVVSIDGLGISASIDGDLRRAYYQLRGQRSDAHEVILVSLDESTVDAWGPPPWRAEQYTAMLTAILAGEPRVVALLPPGQRAIASEPLPASVAAATASGSLIWPTADASGSAWGTDQVPLVLAADGPVEAVWLDMPGWVTGASTLRRIADTAGLDPQRRARIPVNYLGDPDTLPTLPGQRIAKGEIPARTFRDRIVLIGLGSPGLASLVPTPVGPMSAAEVQAHAVLGLAHNAAWMPLSRWLAGLGILVLALGCAVAASRCRLRGVLVSLTVLTVLVLILDYAAFVYGVVQIGAAKPLVAMVVAATTVWLLERHSAAAQLSELARLIPRELNAAISKPRRQSDTDSFWQQFSEISQRYVDCHSTILAELPEDRWHLEIRALVNASGDQIYERRRDVRRLPYKDAYMYQRPMWAQRKLMLPELGLRTLVVPLVAFNRLLGMWLINFPDAALVTPEQLRVVDLLADQIAIAAEQRRLQLVDRPRLAAADRQRDGALMAPLRETRHNTLSLVHHQRGLTHLFERLPVGVLVATLWGEIEVVNDSMRRFLGASGIDDALRLPLPALLVRLTQTSPELAFGILRDLVAGRAFVRLHGRLESAFGRDIAYEMVLSRLAHPGDDLLHEIEAGAVPALSRFVLTISQDVDRDAAAIDWGTRIAEAARHTSAPTMVPQTNAVANSPGVPAEMPLAVDLSASTGVPKYIAVPSSDVGQALQSPPAHSAAIVVSGNKPVASDFEIANTVLGRHVQSAAGAGDQESVRELETANTMLGRAVDVLEPSLPNPSADDLAPYEPTHPDSLTGETHLGPDLSDASLAGTTPAHRRRRQRGQLSLTALERHVHVTESDPQHASTSIAVLEPSGRRQIVEACARSRPHVASAAGSVPVSALQLYPSKLSEDPQ